MKTYRVLKFFYGTGQKEAKECPEEAIAELVEVFSAEDNRTAKDYFRGKYHTERQDAGRVAKYGLYYDYSHNPSLEDSEWA